jgi:YfiH family protein
LSAGARRQAALAAPHELPGGGRVLFTTRAEGNLSSVGGDGAEHGAEARERLRVQLGLAALARGYQVHGTTVGRVRERPPSPVPGARPQDADGQATALAGVGVMVLAADCLPVALGAAGAVAMVHAGWRGLAAGVLEEGVRAVRELSGEGTVVAVIGPGAGPCCYEVGEEVHAALGNRHRDGRRLDLAALARERLLAAGVAEVRAHDRCTICDPALFSHRREGARAGRQAGVAWLS